MDSTIVVLNIPFSTSLKENLTLLFVPFLCLLFTPDVRAQGSHFENQLSDSALPIPKEKNQLFYLQRDPDINTVIYQVNVVDGRIDERNPVSAYWIQYAEGGERKNLNIIQRNMAYGVSSKKNPDGSYELQMVANRNLPLRLAYYEPAQKPVVFTTINKREAVLDRIFVRITGGTVFTPEISYYELVGRDVRTGKAIKQRVKP